MELEKQRYLDELAKLVNIDSVSSEPEGAGKIAAFMKEKYESIGWSVEEVSLSESIAPCLKIVNKEAEHYDVLLLAHMDTVFPLGTAAKRPFRIEGSRAYGPGVIDCKGGMLSGYYALANLQARGALQEAAICVFLNSDHEGISSRYSAGYSTELAGKSRYVLVLEAPSGRTTFRPELRGTKMAPSSCVRPPMALMLASWAVAATETELLPMVMGCSCSLPASGFSRSAGSSKSQLPSGSLSPDWPDRVWKATESGAERLS